MLKFDSAFLPKIQFLKTSAKRSLIKEISSLYPYLEENLILDKIFPKKENITEIKSAQSSANEHRNYVDIIQCNEETLFFKLDQTPWLPALRLIHKYPKMMIVQTIDEGAISHILGGANIMCPGIIKSDSKLIKCPVKTPVAIVGENKSHALAVGIMEMPYDEIVNINKGLAIAVYHVLGDSLWNYHVEK
ncbi:hypothetical protein HZS_3763 [Henneguya salminicola]|nr:hypothetical protein HZS_3763 [Henneguya salminicola]